MSIHSRPMQPRDVRECVSIIAAHPVIGSRYGPAIQLLEPAWLRLFSCEAKSATVFEHIEGSHVRICSVGVSLFVSDDFVRRLKAPPLVWIGPELAERIVRGESPMLPDKQLREANSCAGLNLLVWEGCFRQEFESSAEAHRAMMNGFIDRHRGYLWKELIAPQLESVERLEWTVQTGGSLWDPVKGQYVDLSGLDSQQIVQKPHLIGVTRDLEVSRSNRWHGRGSWVGALFDYNRPELGFNNSEQKLLIAALANEGTDQELAQALGVSVATIKKMWVSIYRRVADHHPEIIPTSTRSENNTAERGQEKRRRLLVYLREHPEELRPVSQKMLGRPAPDTL